MSKLILTEQLKIVIEHIFLILLDLIIIFENKVLLGKRGE